MPRRNAVNRIPRGGFSVRAGGRTVTMKDIERATKLARKVGKTVKSKGLLKTVKGLAVKGAKAGAAAAVGALAEKAWETVNKELNQRLDSKNNGRTLVDAPTDYTGPAAPIAAASVVNTVGRMQLANMSDDRVIHKTSYQTGYPLSAKMKRLLKDHGSSYKVLADSKIEQIGFLGRNYLTQNSGFNLKRYHVPPTRAQLPCLLVRDLVMQNTLNDLTAVYADYRPYSAVAKLKQQFMIKNQSTGLPLELTIHLVKVTDTAMINVVDPNFHSFTDLVGRCFTSPAPIPTTVAGRVPQWYVATDPLTEGSGLERQFTVDTLTSMRSLNYSTIFRGGMEIVESFKKTLAPGDFWNFSHTHSTGNGIDLKLLSQTVTPLPDVTQPSTQINNIVRKDNFPFTYGVIFEAKGKMGEIYYVPELNQLSTYLGPTPTAWSYEYKASAYYVTDPDYASIGPVATVPYVYDNVSSDSLRRASIPDDRKPFFLPFEQIDSSQISEAIPGNVGRGYIPVNTSTAPSSRVYEGSVPG